VSDLWRPFLKVLAEQAGQAIRVLDRFHIMKQLWRSNRRRAGRRG
jgi:transposase